METKKRKELVDAASHYSWEDVRLYIAETCWQDWMLDYIEDPEAEMLTLSDIRAIDKILLDAFEEAHGRRLSYLDRKNLLTY